MKYPFPQSSLRFDVYAFASLSITLALAFSSANASAFSDDGRRDLDAAGAAISRAPADPRIAEALNRISAAQIENTIKTLVSFHTRNTLSSMDTDLPKGQGVNAAADWIESELNRYSAACGGCLEVKRDTFTAPAQTGPHARITRPTVITNIYAVLRGTDPAQSNRVMLVSGHYDSRNTDVMDDHGAAPGANDDASGVAVSLECARVLSKLKMPATLVFAAVAGEEQGLVGSAHLAKLVKSEGWQVEGVLNNDIVGGNTTPGDQLQDKSAVRVFSEGIPVRATPPEIQRIADLGYDSDSPSRELARAVAAVARTYDSSPATVFHPVLEFRTDRFLRGGDHMSFNEQGIAGVRFTEWREDFNHQHQNVRTENGVEYGDLLKFVDVGYVARVARINAATMATLTVAPPPPTAVHIVVSNVDNNTTLRWKSEQGAPAGTRYEVVWRPVAAPDWERFTSEGIRAPDSPGGEYAITLPVSKDNVIFGILAVDAAGYMSPAVVPTPVR